MHVETSCLLISNCKPFHLVSIATAVNDTFDKLFRMFENRGSVRSARSNRHRPVSPWPQRQRETLQYFQCQGEMVKTPSTETPLPATQEHETSNRDIVGDLPIRPSRILQTAGAAELPASSIEASAWKGDYVCFKLPTRLGDCGCVD